jgi:hypothetical protein
MSNKLIIELTSFAVRGADKRVMGFIAEDQYHTVAYRTNCEFRGL